MPSRDPAQRLRDILENVDVVGVFTSGIDFESFCKDRKTLYAVIRALEIISEASRRLPDELKDRWPDIDWPGIAAAGNVFRHEYEGLDESQIWHTVQHDLGPLRQAVTAELGV
jgi:uncharacterized protein with HEPN domain